jgi:hypothetical protein
MRRHVHRFRVFELADERSPSVGGIKTQQTCLCFRIVQIIIVGLGNIDGDFQCHILSGRRMQCLCCCQSIFEPLSHAVAYRHPEMTGEQCRTARERLDWTRLELAAAADVPLWFIAAFEDGKATPDFLAGYEVDLRTALEPEALALRARR